MYYATPSKNFKEKSEKMKRTLLTLFVFSLLTLGLSACGGATPVPAGVEEHPAPDFTLPNALGGEVSLSDYAGEPVFLFFHMAVG